MPLLGRQDFGRSARRVSEARKPVHVARFLVPQRLLSTENVTARIVLHDSLLTPLWVRKASAVVKAYHAWRRIREWRTKSPGRGRAVEHFTKCVNFAAEASF